jgi:hypothetical protein
MTAERSNSGRFGPGNCANPRGRPRKDRSVSATILKELNSSVMITENSQRRKITKLAANTKQIANKGASGELRAAKMVLDLAMRAENDREAAPVAPVLAANDRAIVDRFIARLRATLSEEVHDADAQP